MARFTTDELVAASALLISGIVSLAPDETLALRRETTPSAPGDSLKKEQDTSLIARLGLSQEQQRMIRVAFENKRSELKALSELLDRQREELYNLRFQITEQAERRLDILAAQHVETRLKLHTLHAEMQQEIEAVLTPAQRSMAAHLQNERQVPVSGIRTPAHSERKNTTRH